MINEYLDGKLVAARIETHLRQASQDRLAVQIRRQSSRFGFEFKVEIRIRAGRPAALAES